VPDDPDASLERPTMTTSPPGAVGRPRRRNRLVRGIALVAAPVGEPVDAVAGCGRRVLVIPSGSTLEAHAGQPPAASSRPSAAILLARGAIGRWHEGRTGSGVRPGEQTRRLGVGS
jgi:hypothetical protein